MATIYFTARKRELAGQIVRNTPTAIHLLIGKHTVTIPMQWVDHVIYDNEQEKQ